MPRPLKPANELGRLIRDHVHDDSQRTLKRLPIGYKTLLGIIKRQPSSKDELEQKTVGKLSVILGLSESAIRSHYRQLPSTKVVSAIGSTNIPTSGKPDSHYDRRVLSALIANEDADVFLKAHRGIHEEVRAYGPCLQLRNWLLPERMPNENGLSWSNITISPPAKDQRFEFDRKLIDAALFKSLEGSRNGIKLSLVRLHPLNDVAEEGYWAHFETAWTDYITVQACQSTVIPNRTLRHNHMDLDPSKHGIPSTLTLNFVARFADKAYWLIRRSQTVRQENGRVSFSGEEQIKPEDFDHKNPMEAWTVRTLMEEVYPYRDFSHHSPQAAEVREQILAARYLSLFLEEKYGSFGLVVFIQLGIDSKRFVDLYYRNRLETARRADTEGVRYLLPEAELLQFMQTGRCVAHRMLDRDAILTIAIDELKREEPDDGCARLHHTSLYRMHQTCELLGLCL